MSSVFSIEDHKLNFKRECDKFVFLGDSIDKGKSSIEVLKFLVEFAEENPERVTLILGNRDINKLRFLEELKDESLDLSSSGSFRIPSWEHEFNNFPHELNGKKISILTELILLRTKL